MSGQIRPKQENSPARRPRKHQGASTAYYYSVTESGQEISGAVPPLLAAESQTQKLVTRATIHGLLR